MTTDPLEKIREGLLDGVAAEARRSRRRRTVASLVAVAVLFAGGGLVRASPWDDATDDAVMAGEGTDAADPSKPSTEEGDGKWTQHTLGTFAADREIVGTSFDGGIAVLTVEEPGDVRGYRIKADGSLEEASVDIGTAELRMVTAITDGRTGLVATGNDLHPDFQNFVLTSPDGVSWTKPATTGFEVPMDVFDLVATDERYVAVGTLRTAQDPSQGGFVPAILLSDDGKSWSPAQIPSSDEGSVRSVVSMGTKMYAAGDVGGAPVIWSSNDGGQTWTAATGAPPANEVVASGSTVLAAHSGGEEGGNLALHRSDDAGETWQEADADFADGYGFASFFGDDNGFAIQTAGAYRDAFSSPELCYADIDLCGPRSSVEEEAVLVSADGVDWRHLALDALSGLFRPSSVLHNDAGDTVVLGTTKDGEWATWMWDSSQGDVPTTTHSNDEPQYDGPPIIEYGATLEEGSRYAFALYIHCGMDRLGEFNGVQWALVESPTGDQPETGAGEPVPDDWPVVAQSILGYLTLVDDDRIEYSLEDGEVIGVYAPLPADAEVNGCA